MHLCQTYSISGALLWPPLLYPSWLCDRLFGPANWLNYRSHRCTSSTVTQMTEKNKIVWKKTSHLSSGPLAAEQFVGEKDRGLKD